MPYEINKNYIGRIAQNLGEDGLDLVALLKMEIRSSANTLNITRLDEIVEDVGMLAKSSYDFIRPVIGNNEGIIRAYLSNEDFRLRDLNSSDIIYNTKTKDSVMITAGVINMIVEDLGDLSDYVFDDTKIYIEKLEELRENERVEAYRISPNRVMVLLAGVDPVTAYPNISPSKIDGILEQEVITGGDLSAFYRIRPTSSGHAFEHAAEQQHRG